MNYENRREPFIYADNIKESKEEVVDDIGTPQHKDVVTHQESSTTVAINDHDTSRQSAVHAAEAVMLLAAAVSASYSDEATYTQRGMKLIPQSLLSNEEMKLNQRGVDCRDHTESIKPIQDKAIVQGRLHSFPPSRIFRLNGNARVPDISSSTSCGSATQGDSHDVPIQDNNVGRPKLSEYLREEDGEGDIHVLPWTRRFYEEKRNDKWQTFGNDRESTTSKDDVMMIRTTASVDTEVPLRRPTIGSMTGTNENYTGKNFKTAVAPSYSNCSALFPMQLHCALSHPSTKCKLALEWLSHGKSWRILRWEALDNILPQFFPECGNSIDVFLDSVEAWGFQRIPDGSARYADQGSYYHEFFQLDSPGLCQRMSLHSMNASESANRNSATENNVKRRGATTSVPTTTDASFWNYDAKEEKLAKLDCRASPPLPLARDSVVTTGYEVSRTQSNRGGRPATVYRNTTRGAIPGERHGSRMHSTNNSYRSNLSNSSSFGSSFEENDTYNNGYYADLSYRRSNLIRGNQAAFSFDSSCHASEKVRGSNDLHEQRHCAVVDHSSSTKSVEVRREEDYLRGTSNKRKLSIDNESGSYMGSFGGSFKTPDRKSSSMSCKGDDLIKDNTLPQPDNLRRKQAPVQDVNSKPSVVTPSSAVRSYSLCSSRGGKSATSASFTPVQFSTEVENRTKTTAFNVSRRGSFAKRVSTIKSNHHAADDQPKIMLTFN